MTMLPRELSFVKGKIVGALRPRTPRRDPEAAEFDLQHRTETDGRRFFIYWSHLLTWPFGKRLTLASYYQGCGFIQTQRALEQIAVDHQNFTFLDVGSGKGRVLLQASHWPYKRAVGVEISGNLNAVARKNLHLYRHPDQKCKTLSVCEHDIQQFELPLDNLVIYMCNPFFDRVMKKFIDNIDASLALRPRRVYIVYLVPLLRHLLDAHPRFECWRSADFGGEYQLAIYRNVT